MNHFEYSSNTSYGKMKLPLRAYNFLAHIEATMVGGFAEIELKLYYRIANQTVIEFVISSQLLNDEWDYNIVGRFELKEPFYPGLLEQYMRLYIIGGRNYLGLSYIYHESPVISEKRFRFMMDDIMADLQLARYTTIKKWGDTPLIRYCRSQDLDIHPTPSDGYMDGKCPAGNHRFTLNAPDGTWFCGYCRRKGGLKELRDHVEHWRVRHG